MAGDELPEMESPATRQHHHRRHSSNLSDLSFLSIDVLNEEIKETVDIPEDEPVLPIGSLVVVAQPDDLEADTVAQHITEDLDFEFQNVTSTGDFKVNEWGGKRLYSDYIEAGMKHVKRETEKVVMLFESPSSSKTIDTSFHNTSKYRFHDWPPPKSTKTKVMLGPCRYASMNGNKYPVFLRGGVLPTGVMEHWKDAIPGFVPCTFVPKIEVHEETAYAYLPVEQLEKHVNDPQTHYHLAGKDSIILMTNKTTKLLPDTKTSRPCVVKTTHSMGSKGIFIIRNDEDEKEFEQFLEESGNPTFVVVDFVDIARNVACHFFMHPNGSVVWFGSNENHREPDGRFSSDSYLLMEHQDKLKEMQLPFVQEVVRYCQGLGFWGFCGIDVLFDSQGNGYLVDINPRVTGSCPALMTLRKMRDEFGFLVGIFRRSGDIAYNGSMSEVLAKVKAYNDEHQGRSRVVIHSAVEIGKDQQQKEGASAAVVTKVNIGVYGNNLNECKTTLQRFVQKPKVEVEEAGE